MIVIDIFKKNQRSLLVEDINTHLNLLDNSVGRQLRSGDWRPGSPRRQHYAAPDAASFPKISGDGQLWYSYFDGTNWQSDTQVPNVGMWESPSAAVLPGGGIYVFHQGITGPLFGGDWDGNLWYSYFHFDGSTWDPDKQVRGVGMSSAPSAVVV